MEDYLKPYPKYKEIDLPWLNSIPCHWNLLRNKNFLFDEKEVVGEDSHSFKLLSLTKQGVIYRDIESGKGKFPKEFNSYKIVKEDNLILCLFDIDETPRTVGLSKYEGMITGAYDVFSIKNAVSKYVFYYYLSIDDVKGLKPLYTGLRKVVRPPVFLRSKFPLPPFEEQIQIANFLDYKVALINKFIKDKKLEIKLLKEQKQAEINQAVTRGVNPNAKMKDSGISWIAEIPEHWELKKIKHIAAINPSIQDQIKTHNLNDSVVFLAMENISVDGIINNSEKRLIKDVKSGYTSFAKNDVVIAKITPCFENGKGAFLSELESEIGFGTTELIVLRPKISIIGLYLYYILRSDLILKIGTNFMTGTAGQKRIPTNFIQNFRIGIPTVQEQNLIIETLITKSAQIEKAIEAIENQIKLIQEYKISLISDVATGKVDVRNVAVEKMEDIPEEEIEETEDLENSEE